MTLTSMSFDGYTWEFNSKYLTFSHNTNTNISYYPYGGSTLQNFVKQNCVITGSGCFVGENCTDMYNKLKDKFNSGKIGVLTLPGFPPINAFFSRLVLKGEPKPDVLDYEFEFIEVQDEYLEIASLDESGKSGGKNIRKVIPNGETLWDLSYKYGINVDKLVSLNPQIRRPDIPIEEGQVRLS